MKKAKLILRSEERASENPVEGDFADLTEPINWEIYDIDSRDTKTRRTAQRIVNNYAVSQFPFILLVDGDEEYAAIYSEEGPITVERINEKI